MNFSRNLKVRNQFDLRGYNGPTFVGSYLKKKKMKPIQREVGNKTTLRYFILNLEENTLLYKDHEATPEIRVIHLGKDIRGYSESLDEDEQNLCDWPYGFKIITTIKSYTLFAKSNEVYIRWIEILKALLSLTILEKNEEISETNHFKKVSRRNVDQISKENRQKSPHKFSDENREERSKDFQLNRNQNSSYTIHTQAKKINENSGNSEFLANSMEDVYYKFDREIYNQGNIQNNQNFNLSFKENMAHNNKVSRSNHKFQADHATKFFFDELENRQKIYNNQLGESSEENFKDNKNKKNQNSTLSIETKPNSIIESGILISNNSELLSKSTETKHKLVRQNERQGANVITAKEKSSFNQNKSEIGDSSKFNNVSEKFQVDHISKRNFHETDYKNKIRNNLNQENREEKYIDYPLKKIQNSSISNHKYPNAIIGSSSIISGNSEFLLKPTDIINKVDRQIDNQGTIVKNSKDIISFKAFEAENKTITRANLNQHQLENMSRDAKYVDNSEENYVQKYSPQEDFTNPEKDTLLNKQHNSSVNKTSETSGTSRIYKKSVTKINRDESKSRHEGVMKIHSRNVSFENENSQGGETVERVLTNINNKYHDSNQNTSKFFLGSELNFEQNNIDNNNSVINTQEQYNESKFLQNENFSPGDEQVNTEWNVLNGDWSTVLSYNIKIHSLNEGNKNGDSNIQEQLPRKQYQEKALIKKNLEHKNNFLIENSIYKEDISESMNNSQNIRQKENNSRTSSPFVIMGRGNTGETEDSTGDINQVSVNQGEKVDVKWNLTKNEPSNTKYKIQVPEVMLRDKPVGRIQKLKETLNVNSKIEDSVYLGKDKTYLNDKSILTSFLNNDTFNMSKRTINENEKAYTRHAVNQKNNQVSVIESRNSLNNTKYLVSVPRSDLGDEQYHLKISNTFKINDDTPSLDECNITMSNPSEISQNKVYKSLVTNEDKEKKFISKTSNDDYNNQEMGKFMRNSKSYTIDKMNVSKNNQSEDIISLNSKNSNHTHKKTIVVNKKVRVVKKGPTLEQDIHFTRSVNEDQNINDLSDLDQYYHNISIITKNSKLDTNEHWDSGLSEKDI